MKKIILTAVVLAVNYLSAQTGIDTTIKIDLLKAPASPASTLLGISPSEIEKPTDVSAFMISLQTATNNFSRLPSSYAVDIAPYWLLKNANKGDITTKGYAQSSGKNVFKQTLVISFAFRNPDSSEVQLNSTSAYGGFGFKFFILRGKYDKQTNESLQRIQELQDIKLRHLDKVITNYKSNADSEVIDLRQQMKNMLAGKTTANEVNAVRNSEAFKTIQKQLNTKLAAYRKSEETEASQAIDKEIKEIATSFQSTRIGLTWDVAGGISTEFFKKRFDSSKVYNAGIWTTVGYTDPQYGAGLVLLRVLQNPEQIFAKDNSVTAFHDITTFDAGLRYIYGPSQSKFNASLEAIYRSVLTINTIKPSWRLILNAEYAVLQNQKITFSFGRNFDGAVTKDGNLVAALSFLTGFGNRR
jgi:hypothetical protein